MSDATSARLALPLLRAGQAQKELSHNEALALIDLLLQGNVEAIGVEVPPVAPEPGQCWVVGAVPTGDWSGHGDAIAGWTSAGWRFIAPREGMTLWVTAAGADVRFSGDSWTLGAVRGSAVLIDGVAVVGAQRPAITEPDAGGVIDVEARAAITAILAALRGHGLIEG